MVFLGCLRNPLKRRFFKVLLLRHTRTRTRDCISVIEFHICFLKQKTTLDNQATFGMRNLLKTLQDFRIFAYNSYWKLRDSPNIKISFFPVDWRLSMSRFIFPPSIEFPGEFYLMVEFPREFYMNKKSHVKFPPPLMLDFPPKIKW